MNTEKKMMLRFLLPWFVVQFFTWLALFAMWIYTTPFVLKYIFTEAQSENELAYSKAATLVGFCFAFYSLLAASLAFIIPKLTAKFPVPKVHSVALFFGALGLLAMYYASQKAMLVLAFGFIGIAWSSIGNLPYSAVGNKAPEEKISFYMSVFNFSIVIPQVLAAFLLGWLTNTVFAGEVKYTMLAGSGCMFIASVVCWFVIGRQKLAADE